MITYRINPIMEFIPLDETEQVIYDGESGDIHYLDEISSVILSQLNQPLTLDALVERLLELFEGDSDEIRSDTLEFLNEMTTKNVVLIADDEK